MNDLIVFCSTSAIDSDSEVIVLYPDGKKEIGTVEEIDYSERGILIKVVRGMIDPLSIHVVSIHLVPEDEIGFAKIEEEPEEEG